MTLSEASFEVSGAYPPQLIAKRDQLEGKDNCQVAEEHQLKQRVNIGRQRLRS